MSRSNLRNFLLKNIERAGGATSLNRLIVNARNREMHSTPDILDELSKMIIDKSIFTYIVNGEIRVGVIK